MATQDRDPEQHGQCCIEECSPPPGFGSLTLLTRPSGVATHWVPFPVQKLPHTTCSPAERGMVGVMGIANIPNNSAKHATQAKARRRLRLMIRSCCFFMSAI